MGTCASLLAYAYVGKHVYTRKKQVKNMSRIHTNSISQKPFKSTILWNQIFTCKICLLFCFALVRKRNTKKTGQISLHLHCDHVRLVDLLYCCCEIRCHSIPYVCCKEFLSCFCSVIFFFQTTGPLYNTAKCLPPIISCFLFKLLLLEY